MIAFISEVALSLQESKMTIDYNDEYQYLEEWLTQLGEKLPALKAGSGVIIYSIELKEITPIH
jgi:hypothetical protein